MALLAPARTQQLVELTQAELRAGIERRRGRDIVLFDLATEALCRAVCAWSGVSLRESEVASRTADFISMIEAGGRVGVAQWRGRLARRRAERWVSGLVRSVREGRLAAPTGSVLETVARQVDARGEQLRERVAAVELLNVLRPTVAVAYYITFTALALQSHVEARRALLDGSCEPLWFVQEVRRSYPFFPFVAARTREPFEWGGYRFPVGTRTLLDLYGTNHDARSWPEPERFMPERFREWEGDPFALIPQGAGDTATGHRCPGETVTIELMQMALEM